MEGHNAKISAIAFSIDGRRIVSGSWDSTILLWDAETARKLCNPMKGHRGPVNCVAVSPDGRFIVSGSVDSTIRIWDTQTGRQMGEPFNGHVCPYNLNYGKGVTYVTFSPDSERIVSLGADDTIGGLGDWP
jgi:WD40 repeat protein